MKVLEELGVEVELFATGIFFTAKTLDGCVPEEDLEDDAAENDDAKDVEAAGRRGS